MALVGYYSNSVSIGIHLNLQNAMTREEAFQIFLEESKKKLQDPRMTWEVLIASAFNTAWEVAKEDTVCKACEWLDEYFPTRGNGDTTFIRIAAVKECFRKAMED